MRPTVTTRLALGAAALLLTALTACSDPPDVPEVCTPDGGISVYTSTEIGSEAWFTELAQVKAACFDSVVAYGSMNGSSIDGIKLGLDEAQRLGIGVVFSVKDVLGMTDTDETNADLHRELFGKSTDTQIATVARRLLGHPAIKSVLTSDERPTGPDDLQEWLPALKKRYSQINKIKPVSVVLYWNPGSPGFYKAVKKHATELQIDYYPVPENDIYGSVAAISDIGEMLWQTAGTNGTFVLQAFGWDPVTHPEGPALGFTEASPPPTTAEMVNMAKLAVQGNGNGGAVNLAFYLLGEPGSASTDSMRDAVQQIRAAEWWKNRGN